MSYLLLDLRWELTTTPALAEGGEPSIWDTRLQLRVLVIRDSASRLPRVPRTEEHNYVVNSCINKTIKIFSLLYVCSTLIHDINNDSIAYTKFPVHLYLQGCLILWGVMMLGDDMLGLIGDGVRRGCLGLRLGDRGVWRSSGEVRP